MTEVMIWEPLEIFLWGMAFILLSNISIIYYKKARERERISEKRLLYGYSGAIFAQGFMIFFIILSKLSISGVFKNNKFYADLSNSGPLFDIFFNLTWILHFSSTFLFTLAFEISIKRTRYILSIMNIILMFIITGLPRHSPYFFTISSLIYSLNAIILFTAVILLIKWSQIEFKGYISFLVLAITISAHGFVSTMPHVLELNILPLWIPPLMIFLTGFFYLVPFLITSENVSRMKFYWILSSLFTLGLQILFVFFQIFTGFPFEQYSGTIIYTFFFIYMLYLCLKSIYSPTTGDSFLKDKKQYISVLEAFTRPQKITEEEVSISKEKKICLVCKGRVRKFDIFICDCGAFYCDKCVHALIGLENICWACNNTLDETKPVKLPEKKEEQEAFIEKETHNKGI